MYTGIIIILVALLCLAWAHWGEPKLLSLTRVSVPLEAWKGTEKKARFVLISDFHLAPGENERQQRIVNKILDLNPDFVVIAGDFCKGSGGKESMTPVEMAEGFAELARRLPVYAVLGNHDEGGLTNSGELRNAFVEKGFLMMETAEQEWGNERGTPLVLAGLPDDDAFSATSGRIPQKKRAELPLILISHSPDIMPVVPEYVDLVLCGHTHGGQVCLPGGIPLVASTRKTGLKYAYGLKKQGRTHVLVTRGLGMSIMDIRFCCPPEIMLVELTGKEG